MKSVHGNEAVANFTFEHPTGIPPEEGDELHGSANINGTFVYLLSVFKRNKTTGKLMIVAKPYHSIQKKE